ncbi:MAG: alpha/beta hydrolase [Planctomycetales bacterium]|nr:alpha/beta hydrolase [Planctomycetales bacterium]
MDCKSVFVLLLSIFIAPNSLWAADDFDESRVYREVDGRQLRIFTSMPKTQGDGLRASIVFFHGGGWTGGNPDQFVAHCEHYAKLGLVCFSVEYRLLKKDNSDPPKICLEDARCAMRWVREHAKDFAIDPDRIAAAGGSAGGHLAAAIGMIDDASVEEVSSKCNALILFNPVYDNGPGGWGTSRVGDRFAEFSPAHNISRDDPPSIVFLGTNDNLIPVSTALKFRDDCIAAGIYSELHLYEDQAHGFFNSNRDDGKWYRETIKSADAFLRHLNWISAQSADSE